MCAQVPGGARGRPHDRAAEPVVAATHVQRGACRSAAATCAATLGDVAAGRVCRCGVQAEPITCASIELFLHTFAPFGVSAAAMRPGYGLAEHTVYVSDSGAEVLLVSKEELEVHGRVVEVFERMPLAELLTSSASLLSLLSWLSWLSWLSVVSALYRLSAYGVNR